VILELQGELQSRYNNGLDNNLIGDLHFKLDGTPILILGHHVLYGKIKKLEKPFAVLEKNTDQQQHKPGAVVDKFGVKAIIKTKVLFTLRPKPIIMLASP